MGHHDRHGDGVYSQRSSSGGGDIDRGEDVVHQQHGAQSLGEEHLATKQEQLLQSAGKRKQACVKTCPPVNTAGSHELEPKALAAGQLVPKIDCKMAAPVK